MAHWIAFALFLLASISDLVFAWNLRKETPWQFLLAGNPMQPDGSRLYRKTQSFQKASVVLCSVYAATFAMVAAVTLLTLIFPVLSQTILAVGLYVHGAVILLGAAAFLAYLDSCCDPKQPNQMLDMQKYKEQQ